jgi:hypothetical protein
LTLAGDTSDVQCAWNIYTTVYTASGTHASSARVEGNIGVDTLPALGANDRTSSLIGETLAPEGSSTTVALR